MKKVKLIVELCFIFLLPLLFIALTCSIKTVKEYDSNNNEINKESYIESSYPFSDFKNENHYINIFPDFNIWNEQWELGAYNSTTGDKQVKTDRIRCKDKIKVDYSTLYYFKSTNAGYFCIYDINEQFIVSVAINPNNIIDLSSYTNASYITFNLSTGYGTTYKNNICINISNSYVNGIYEPYGDTLYFEYNSIIASDWQYNYSPWGSFIHLVIDYLYLADTPLLRILLMYFIMFMLMFLLWHVVYLPIDWIVHLGVKPLKE